MQSTESEPITRLLDAVNGGAPGAFARLVDAIYDDLRRIANNKMKARIDVPIGALTMAPTQIASDAVLELMRQRAEWKNREHFFAIAARLIGRLVRQYKRGRDADRRGGGDRGQAMDERVHGVETHAAASEQRLALLEVLEQLELAHPRPAEVATLHVFTGHTLPEVAQMLELSVPTVERDWKFAKAWLKTRLSEGSQ